MYSPALRLEDPAVAVSRVGGTRALAVAEEVAAIGDGVRYRQLSIVVELLPVLGVGHESGGLAAEPVASPVGRTTHLATRVYLESVLGERARRRGALLDVAV